MLKISYDSYDHGEFCSFNDILGLFTASWTSVYDANLKLKSIEERVTACVSSSSTINKDDASLLANVREAYKSL